MRAKTVLKTNKREHECSVAENIVQYEAGLRQA